MDPDHGDAADATTYAGGGGYAGGEESWACALLRRGWDLSRKAVIASVAATAAPVIAPPIIILSIAGVALSVPFAACLASFAATERLMGALLPPATPQPYYSYDLGDDEPEQQFVDASEAPDQEVPVFGCLSKTEEDAIMEQHEGFASLPLSLEPRLSEELVPLLANEEGDSAEGEFAIQKSGHELFVPKEKVPSMEVDNDNDTSKYPKQKDNDTSLEVDNEYITMEAPSPGIISLPEVPVFHEEDSMFRRMEDSPLPAMESVQELSVSDNENKTEDGKSTVTVDNETSKEMLSPGIDATELSNLRVPMLGNKNNIIQREGEGGVSVWKQGQDFHVSDDGDKTEQHKTTEVTPPHEVDVSESSVPDSMVSINLEDELAVEMAPQEEMRHTNPVTGEVADVQLDVIAIVEPESESLQSRHPVSCELQAMTESAYVYDTLGSNSTEGIVKDIDSKSAEGVPSMATVDDDKDLISSRSGPNVSTISDGMTSVGSKPHADNPNPTTCVANKEHGRKEVAEVKCVKTEETKTMDKVPITDMAAQDDHISKSLVPDHRSMREDESTVEMVLEQVTSSIDPVTGEVVEVKVDNIARESESLSLSALVAHDLGRFWVAFRFQKAEAETNSELFDQTF